MVPQGPHGHLVHVECVVEAIMVVVVARSSDDRSHDIVIAEIRDLAKLAFVEEQEHKLGNVRPVKVVVVLNLFPVAFLNLVEEEHKLLVVYTLRIIPLIEHRHTVKQMSNQVWQSMRSANVIRELEHVKLVS